MRYINTNENFNDLVIRKFGGEPKILKLLFNRNCLYLITFYETKCPYFKLHK